MNIINNSSVTTPDSNLSSGTLSFSESYFDSAIDYIKKFIYMISILGVLCGVFIAEIVMASLYQFDITCYSNILNPNVWLIVNGVAGCIWIFLLLIISQINILANNISGTDDYDNESLYYLNFIRIVFSLFRFSWLISGSIMFWRDCPNLK